jgi:UDP-2,3-diacylglucosamine pyrophosphatase LpxH
VTQIIHGHTHRPALHKTETYTRYVLPAWHPKGGMVIAKPHSPPELVIF